MFPQVRRGIGAILCPLCTPNSIFLNPHYGNFQGPFSEKPLREDTDTLFSAIKGV